MRGFSKPSDGLEPSTPSLPCAPKPLPWVATGCRSAHLSRFGRVPFATGCDRLRPLGSTNAPCLGAEVLIGAAALKAVERGLVWAVGRKLAHYVTREGSL